LLSRPLPRIGVNLRHHIKNAALPEQAVGQQVFVVAIRTTDQRRWKDSRVFSSNQHPTSLNQMDPVRVFVTYVNRQTTRNESRACGMTSSKRWSLSWKNKKHKIHYLKSLFCRRDQVPGLVAPQEFGQPQETVSQVFCPVTLHGQIDAGDVGAVVVRTGGDHQLVLVEFPQSCG